jgi:hypothetical protein
MFKHPSSSLTHAQSRKRRRNGISSSGTELESEGIPPDLTQTMSVWHTNVGNSHVRRSIIPLQVEASGVQLEDQTLDQAEGMIVEPDTATRKNKRRRKRGNDSVSPSNFYFS